MHGERAVAGAPPRPAVAAGSITNVAANPPIQRVVFKIKKSGKVKYAPDDGFTAPPPGYLRMADADFAIWKGAGKRRPSNKMMDSRTGERYVATPHGFCGLLNKMPQMHQPMPPHAVVVDRTRPDRSAQQSPLLPFDVGGYHSGASLGAVTYPRTPDVQKRWEGERDHSPSGASLKLRQAKQMDRPKAYSQGVTMANDTRMHADHSPTHSHHQQTVDEVVDQHGVTTQQKRLQVDRAHPAVALHRDMFEILAGTRNQNWNTPGVHTVGQPRLDLTDRNNRLVQHGAYRTKYRANTRMNEFLGNDRGVNPKDPAYKLTRLPATVGKKKKGKLPTAKRPYRLTRIPHQMQGDRTRLKFGRTLRKEHYLL